MNVAALWDQLVDAVCRPPRDDAYTEADLVGGRRASFRQVAAGPSSHGALDFSLQGTSCGRIFCTSAIQAQSLCAHRSVIFTLPRCVGGMRTPFCSPASTHLHYGPHVCRLYDRKYYRQDVTLTNRRGQKLQASHYRPCVVTSADGRLPVVVYCHCECTSHCST